MDSLSSIENTKKVPHFKDAIIDIQKYSSYGIDCVYLMGVFERDTGKFEGGYRRPNASPIALTSRTDPCEMLGGEQGFKELLDRSRQIGMKVITDCTARVSSSRFQKKYEPYILHCIDDSGRKQPFYGAEGRSINYEDTVILNYRKLEVWDLLIQEVISSANKYGISGIYLDDGSSWPNLFDINTDEMYRKEGTNNYYSNQ